MKLTHTLKPIYNKYSKILILGSFPSEISRQNNFYYANKNNRFWKVMELIFNIKLNTNEEKEQFLLKNNIALFDVIYSCEIYKSADSSIKNVKVNNIKKIIKNSKIKTIYVTGKTALKYYNEYLYNKLKIQAKYLPSTSSANASFSLDKLVNIYKIILYDLNN